MRRLAGKLFLRWILAGIFFIIYLCITKASLRAKRSNLNNEIASSLSLLAMTQGYQHRCSCIYARLYSIAWAQERTENFISPEKAFEAISDSWEVKSLENKYHCEKFQCPGYGIDVSVKRWPNKYFPFYVLHFFITKDSEKSPGFFVAEEIVFKSFYIDAYTAKVYAEDITREIIAQKQEDRDIYSIEKALLIEKERVLKIELEEIYRQIRQRGFLAIKGNKELCQKSFPVFLKSLNAVTPEIRLQGVRILRRLADVSEPSGGFRGDEVIPRLIKLLKDNDYRLRYEAVTVLADMGEKGDRSLIEPIRVLLSDSDKLVRKIAAKALTKLGDSKLASK